MTFVGKLLTVLILICSIFLTAVAVMLAASQQNWKMQATENAAEVRKLSQILQDSQNRTEEIKTDLQRERVTSRLALQRSQVQLLVEQAKNTQKEEALAQEILKSQEQLRILKQNEDRLAELTTQNKDLRQRTNELTTSLHNTLQQVTTLTDENYSLEGRMQRLEEKRDQLANDLAQFAKVMKAYGLDENSLTAHIPPRVEGRVLVVSNKIKGLVELSLGEDDGIRVGHKFDVFRDSKYLGSVVVKTVTHNRATAEIVPELNEAPIRANDRVTTELESQLRG